MPENSDAHIRRQKANKEDMNRISAAFFFNARDTNVERTSVGLYKTLLFRILDQVPAIHRRHARGLQDRYEKMVEQTQEGAGGPDSWEVLELGQMFTSVYVHKDIKVSIILF